MAVMLLPNNAPAKAPDTLWTKTYGGSNWDWGYAVAQTRDGGYIVAGETGSYPNYDIYLIKTGANGDTLWTKTYGRSDEDGSYSVAQTTDGCYIIAGWTRSYGAGGGDVYLIKGDGYGDTLWTRTYGRSDNDWGYSVAQTSDGGYIIAGHAESWPANTGYDVYLIKTDADGDTLWTKIYGGIHDDRGYSVAQTRDGGYIIAGWTGSFGAGKYDVYLIKTGANGDTLWTRTYGGSGNDMGFSVAQTCDSGYIIAGYTRSFGAGGYDVYLIKTDSNGDTLWTKTYGGSGNDMGYSVAQTSDGGYIVAGYTYSYGAGNGDVYLIRTNANGDTIWTKSVGGNSDDAGYSVAQTSDGGYIIAGWTRSYGAGGDDVYLVRLGPEGAVEENSNLKKENSYLRLGQNPFSRTTTISYQVPERSDVSLSVYDLSGREIKRLVDNVQERGDYHLKLDMTGYAEGVYFIKFTAGTISSVKKVIALK